jgi:hypothetical protein
MGVSFRTEMIINITHLGLPYEIQDNRHTDGQDAKLCSI